MITVAPGRRRAPRPAAPGAPTLREAREAADEADRQAALAEPVVQAALAAFPDAILESWPRKQA